MDRRNFLASGLATVGAAAAGSAAHAQGAFPSKPVTLICPWPAGGPTDVVMRVMAEAASKHLGQPIVVDNKAGASGTLGAATMAAAKDRSSGAGSTTRPRRKRHSSRTVRASVTTGVMSSTRTLIDGASTAPGCSSITTASRSFVTDPAASRSRSWVQSEIGRAHV